MHRVRSAMPMLKALEAHPHAVVIPHEYEEISNSGHELHQLMRELTPAVKPLSIDETFWISAARMPYTKRPSLLSWLNLCRELKNIGITISVGFSYCKFLAKVATKLI